MAYDDQQIQRLWIFGNDENGNQLPPFDFDAVTSEGHTSKLSIMDNPVETGVVITDHAFMLPRELEIQGVVSDVWLRMRDPDRDKVTALNDDADWLVPADRGDSSGRAARAFQLMLGLQASATPFDVQTGLRLYTNMLIKEISANQDARTASALVFRAVLREVQFVSTQVVKYTPRADKPTTRKASAKTTSGEKQATPPATDQKSASVALQALRATGAVH